jgi:zinc transporter, ZIP family
VSFIETVLLGAIAGLTIYLGLPLGRAHRVGERSRAALAMLSVGILAFIFMDVTAHGQEIVARSLRSFHDHHAGLGQVVLRFLLLAAGFTLGTVGIAAAEGRLATAARARPDAAARALRTGMTIAAAIGLHNFAEGLAIGVSARTGEIALAAVLIVGFGLHNATEGFGIIGPLGSVRPSWRWLGLVGLIGGGPTFLGTVVGYELHSDPLELCFYALAGGAIIFVVGEIWAASRRSGHRLLGLTMLASGFLVGVATDLIVSYGGG